MDEIFEEQEQVNDGDDVQGEKENENDAENANNTNESIQQNQTKE